MACKERGDNLETLFAIAQKNIVAQRIEKYGEKREPDNYSNYSNEQGTIITKRGNLFLELA